MSDVGHLLHGKNQFYGRLQIALPRPAAAISDPLCNKTALEVMRRN